MELDFDKIKRIRKIRSVKSDLSKEENILIKPILSDKKLIPLIYKTFTNIICKKSDEGISRHYKIFCVNVKYGIHYWFRIFLFNSFAK